MSYVVHFWNFPVPRSVEHAVKIFDELSGAVRPRNRAFLELAQLLTARHPCLTTLQGDDGVWSDGPLDGVTDSATYGIGIQTRHLTEVYPFVVETATSLGLVVYDEQAGEVHLPGGETQTLAGRRVGKHLGLALGDTLTPALVERTMTDAILPILATEGFEPNRAFGAVHRRYPAGNQSLRMRLIDSSPDRIAFDLDIFLVDDGMRKIIDQLLQKATNGREKHTATAIGSTALACRFFRIAEAHAKLQDDSSVRFEIHSIDALRQLSIALRFLFADHLRAKLNHWKDTTQIALSLFDHGHDRYRTIGSLVSTTESGGIRSSLFGGRLLDTRRCGGDAIGLFLAAFAKAPMLQELVEQAYASAARQPPERLADEKAKLDICLATLKAAKMVA